MSKNCLVTKLVGVVNNDELERLGVLVLSINEAPQTNGSIAAYTAGDPITYTIVGDGIFTDSTGTLDYGKSVTVPASVNPTSLYFTPFVGTIEIDSKYDFAGNIGTTLFGFKTSDFTYTKVQTIFMDSSKVEGKISDLPATLIDIRTSDSATGKITGKLTDFLKFTGLKSLRISGGTPYNIESGNINVLGHLKSLNSLNYNGLTGTIEGFVAAQRAGTDGRTSVLSSAPVMLYYMNTTSVTFQGNSIASGTKSLYWDANTITFDGVTINNNAVGYDQ